MISRLSKIRLRGIKPKLQPLIYDYTQVDKENPFRPIDDEEISYESGPYLSSFSFYLSLYFIGGYSIYFFTRLSYDYDWDRFYHVNYPAMMQFLDYFMAYYGKKKEDTIKNLPSGVREVKESIWKKKEAQNKENKLATVDDKGVEVESKVAEEIKKLLES